MRLPVRLLGAALLAAPAALHAQTPLYAVESPAPQDGALFGRAIVALGDLDGDGRREFAVGAPYESPSDSIAFEGAVHLFDEATGALLGRLRSPSPRAAGNFGETVALVPSVNGDRVPDLAVGARGEGADRAGRVHVFDGATRAHLHTLASPNPRSNGNFGGTIAPAGDVNGDGAPELYVGAPSEGSFPYDMGRAYLLDPLSGEVHCTFASPSTPARGSFGHRVAIGADLDGDGVPDPVIGAPSEDTGTSPRIAGRVHAFSGATCTRLYTLVPPVAREYGAFGLSITPLDDLDGDGRPDFAVGAPGNSADAGPLQAGRVYVYSGRTGALLRTIASPQEQEHGGFGAELEAVQDVDGDGVADLLVGTTEDYAGYPEAGRIYVVSGATGAALAVFGSPTPTEYSGFGLTITRTGNPDGSGGPDLLVGAIEDRDRSSFWIGRVYAFSGGLAVSAAPEPPATAVSLVAVPNPSHGAATLRFTLPEAGAVRLAAYDVLGREVAVLADGEATAGSHEVRLDRGSLAPGAYLLRLKASGTVATHRLTVLR
jgi:hypothetical protein